MIHNCSKQWTDFNNLQYSICVPIKQQSHTRKRSTNVTEIVYLRQWKASRVFIHSRWFPVYSVRHHRSTLTAKWADGETEALPQAHHLPSESCSPVQYLPNTVQIERTVLFSFATMKTTDAYKIDAKILLVVIQKDLELCLFVHYFLKKWRKTFLFNILQCYKLIQVNDLIKKRSNYKFNIFFWKFPPHRCLKNCMNNNGKSWKIECLRIEIQLNLVEYENEMPYSSSCNKTTHKFPLLVKYICSVFRFHVLTKLCWVFIVFHLSIILI